MSVETRSMPSVARESRVWGLCLLGTGLSFLLSLGIAPRLTLSPFLAFAVGFMCVAAATLAASRFAPTALHEGLPVVLGAVAVILGSYVLRASGWSSALAVSIALLAAGSALGALVGTRIEHPGHLLFVALASSLADTFSVTAPDGPSAAIAQSDVALSLVAMSWPMLGSRGIEPFLGVGDIVFSGLYLGCARKHAFVLRRTLIALAGGYGLTMLAVLALQTALPALPFLGGAMLAAHPEARRPPATDRRRGWLALSVMAALFLVLLLRPRQ